MPTLRENLERALRGEDLEQFPFGVYGSILDQARFSGEEDTSDIARVEFVAPWEVKYESVTTETTTQSEGSRVTVFRTPVGELAQRWVLEPGYGSFWAMEHYIKRPEDWRVLQYLVEDTRYVPNLEAYEEAEARVGEAGLVIASVPRMPFQRLWIEFGDLEQLVFLLADDRRRTDRLVSLLTLSAREAWEIAAESESEFIWCPDNLTADVMSPELYRRYGQPYYEAVAEVTRPRGKKLVAHMDGQLAALADLIAQTPVNVVESFTPPPNGNLRLADAWERWSDKVLWVNFPPALHLLEAQEMQERLWELAASVPQRRRLAFEISENIPEDLVAGNLLTLAEAIQEA